MVARDVNSHVLVTAARMDDVIALADYELFEFLCECGCLAPVTISPAVYVGQDGAWLTGHRPVAASTSAD